MKQFQIFWRDNTPLQFRNTIGAEPALPETIYADDYNIISVGNSFIGISFFRNGESFITFFEIPVFIRDLDGPVPQ